MDRWWILAVFVVWLLIMFVVLSACRAARLADDAMFDWAHDDQTRPCPQCESFNVYVDADDMCFCCNCRVAFPLAPRVKGAP